MYKNYIGKTEELEEVIDLIQVQKIIATLGFIKPLENGDNLPYLWQWCFFNKAYKSEFLGRDGHPRLGEGAFLPSFGEVNRMWAGGRFSFFSPLKIGVLTKKKTTIKDIVQKEGKSGKLVFVTLLHEYFQAGELNLSEEQDIVYKAPSKPKLVSDKKAPKADFSKEYNPNSTLLFRYSALTFNGHKIHYDFPYATNIEGYHGLVIHGPILATLMLSDFISNNPDKIIKTYSYKGLHALCVPDRFLVEGSMQELNKASMWINKDGYIAHMSEVTFIKD